MYISKPSTKQVMRGAFKKVYRQKGREAGRERKGPNQLSMMTGSDTVLDTGGIIIPYRHPKVWILVRNVHWISTGN